MGITVYNDQMLNNLGLKLAKYFQDEAYSNTTKPIKFKYTKFFKNTEPVDETTLQKCKEIILENTNGLPNDFDISTFYMVLTILYAKSQDSNLPRLLSNLVATVDQYFTKELVRHVIYLTGTPKRITSFLEDWEALYKLLTEEYKVYDIVKADLTALAKKYLKVLTNIDTNVDILLSDSNLDYSLSILPEYPVVFRPTFLFNIFNMPGIFKITYGDGRFEKLASLVNETNLSFFKFFLNTEFREDGCVTIYFNKQENSFVAIV